MCYMSFTSVEWEALLSPTLQILLLCRADHCTSSYQVSHRSSSSCFCVSASSFPLPCLPSRCMSTILSPKHSQGLHTSWVQHPPLHRHAVLTRTLSLVCSSGLQGHTLSSHMKPTQLSWLLMILFRSLTPCLSHLSPDCSLKSCAPPHPWLTPSFQQCSLIL